MCYIYITCIHVYIYVYTYIDTLYIVFVHVPTYKYMCLCVNYLCVFLHMHIYCIWVSTYIIIHVSMCIYSICVYIHIESHILSLFSYACGVSEVIWILITLGFKDLHAYNEVSEVWNPSLDMRVFMFHSCVSHSPVTHSLKTISCNISSTPGCCLQPIPWGQK